MAEIDQDRARPAAEFLDRAAARNVELDAGNLGTARQDAAVAHDDEVGGCPDLVIGQRSGRQLGADARGVADGKGEDGPAAVG